MISVNLRHAIVLSFGVSAGAELIAVLDRVSDEHKAADAPTPTHDPATDLVSVSGQPLGESSAPSEPVVTAPVVVVPSFLSAPANPVTEDDSSHLDGPSA